jgi:hypothetical protein
MFPDYKHHLATLTEICCDLHQLSAKCKDKIKGTEGHVSWKLKFLQHGASYPEKWQQQIV